MNIGFIGVGNMGGAILHGYSEIGARDGNTLFAFGRNQEKLRKICKETNAIMCHSIQELVEQCEMIILGVKPNSYEEVLPQIANRFQGEKVLVSMAAGKSIEDIESFLGDDAMVIRIMPNTPAKVSAAMTSISGNNNVSDKFFEMTKRIMGSIGNVQEVPEAMIHSVIGISGSSPAYAYMYMDALARAAVSEGMDYETALNFVAQATMGAAKMVIQKEGSPEQLRVNVCSPGGTTIEGVKALQGNGFEGNIQEAFKAVVARSKEMSQ